MTLFLSTFRQLCAGAIGAAALTVGLAQATIAQAEVQAVPTNNAQAADYIVGQNPESSVPGALPALPTPAPTPFSPNAGIVDLSTRTHAIRSLGQLRPRDVDSLAAEDREAGWIKSMILPLYASPGGEHWGWIYQGWLIPKGQTYLALGRDASVAMVHAYEDVYTFPVLEAREDGWFRVQYTPGGSAWAHSSQLELGAMPLVVEGWETRLQAQDSVYFLQTDEAQALRSQPETTSNMLSLVAAGSLIEPLAFQGDWMQARVTRPASACRPLTGATVTEGWMQWRGNEGEALVWYQPGGGCG